MAKKRTPHSAEFKAKVALDALREQKTLAELSQDYKLQSTQISAWKSALRDGAALVFDKHRSLKEREEYEAREKELYARIGQLQMELEWVKKVGLAEWSVEQRRQLIEPELDEISFVRQCELFDLARSSYYYEPCLENVENLALMRLIDEQYLITPFYGYRRMAAHLRMESHAVGEERIRRLMRLMGLEALYQ